MKTTVLIMTYGMLVGVAVAVGLRSEPIPQTLSRIPVRIQNGAFLLEGDLSDGAATAAIANVPARQAIEVVFTSDDYIYLIQQPELKNSVIVLPRRTATMVLNLQPGGWSIVIAPGCGALFQGHEGALTLNAID